MPSKTTLTAALFATLLAAAPAQAAGKVVNDRILVQLPDAQTDAELQAAIDEMSADTGLTLSIERRSILDWYVLEVSAERPMNKADLQPAVERISQKRRGVTLDRIVKSSTTFNDPGIAQQHAIDSLNLSAAWDTTTGDPNLVVAVVDSGIIDHEDLQGQVLSGYDFVSDAATSGDNDGRDPNPFDDGATPLDCGQGPRSTGFHGTMVSGVVAALANNSTGVAGAAPDVRLTAIRALGACGGSTLDIAEAAFWAAGGEVAGVPTNPNPAQVVNLSLGGQGACDPLSQEVFSVLADNGVVTVVAAGNESQDTANVTPASCADVITVAASDHDNYLSSFSNYGSEVDLVAPGGDIAFYGADEAGILTTTGPGADAYTFTEGTSFAAPYVSAIAALVKSVNPGLDAEGVRAALLSTSADALCPDASGNYGPCNRPLADAAAAVQAAGAGTPETPAPVDGGAEDDDNAEELVLTCGTTLSGTVTEFVAVRMSLPETTEIELVLSWNNDADLDLYIFDSTGETALDASEQEATDFEALDGEYAAGDYFAAVNPFEGSAAFELSLDCDLAADSGESSGRNRGRGCSMSAGQGSPSASLALLLLAAVGLRRRVGSRG